MTPSNDDRLAILETRSEERHAHHRETLERIDLKIKDICSKVTIMVTDLKKIELNQITIKEEILSRSQRYTNRLVSFVVGIPMTILVLIKVADVLK